MCMCVSVWVRDCPRRKINIYFNRGRRRRFPRTQTHGFFFSFEWPVSEEATHELGFVWVWSFRRGSLVVRGKTVVIRVAVMIVVSVNDDRVNQLVSVSFVSPCGWKWVTRGKVYAVFFQSFLVPNLFGKKVQVLIMDWYQTLKDFLVFFLLLNDFEFEWDFWSKNLKPFW